MTNFQPFSTRLSFTNINQKTNSAGVPLGATLVNPYNAFVGGNPFPYKGTFTSGGGLFPVALTARKIDIEHVYLVVTSGDFAVGPDQERAIGERGLVDLDHDRAQEEMRAELARELPARRQHGMLGL